MTLRVNPEFAALLAAATTTNIAWSSAFKLGLGDTRRVKCVRHADASTPQEAVYATGVKFRDAALTGPITIAGGIVTNYGVTSNLTTSLAADLNGGIAILRIEGNGNWIEGTLGLPNSSCDFVFPVNPTATNSIAVSPNMRITPPPFLPSGTGFAPPTLDVDAPAYVIMDIGPDLAHLTEGGRIHFNNRIKNWTFEDAEYAANVGDVRVTLSTESIIYGDMEIGLALLSVDPQVGTLAGKVKHQIVGGYKPLESNWSGYPRPTGATGGGYKTGTRTMNGVSGIKYGISNTFPGPHRFRIFTADDRQIGIIDMPRDGTLINGSHLSEVPTATKPLRLHLHCASMVFWESHPSKLNSYAKKYFSGIAPEFMRASQMKNPANSNAVYAPYSFAQIDGLNHWYAVGKWSYPANNTATAAAANTLDPYLFTASSTLATPGWASWFGVQPSDMGTAAGAVHLVGQWGYEPGAWACHDGFSGPGGYRVDRAIIPTPIAIHLTDPNWVHLHDGTPIAEMVDHWNRAYFNRAVHHFTDVKNFEGLPTQEVLDGKWANWDVYYNGSAVFTDLDHSVAKFVFSNGSTSFADRPHDGAFTDANFRMPYNGESNDFFHNYDSVAWVALMYNSPAHALSQKFRYFEHIQAQCDKTKASDAWKTFLIRSHAWYLFQESMMWKLASDHPFGVTRAQVERRLEDFFMGIYTNVHLPVFVNNDQSMVSRCIRNLGIKVQFNDGLGWAPSSFTLHYYMAHELVVCRQFGLLKAMMDRSPQIKAAILTMIKCLDKGCIDYYLDTDGCYSGSVYNQGVNLWVGDRTVNSETTEVAASWADWLARVNPKAGPLEDLVHKADGTVRGLDIGEWSRLQWPFIRRDFLADIPCDRDVVACCNKISAWLQVYTNSVNAQIAANASKRTIANTDVAVHPALGRLLPPTILEP